ncbi:conserved Plasmodium protein, unknown function [Plasmodium berghei]|uniref:Uncharacterized protein n=2 Tax=Plasmodium berghei TaxID=5821 RepID=A0A509AVV5_PLABA|nr:conserved protein, unknown function [Plasmodium berghei ANKA]CXJ29741.1 conserved Plasmodium protein, unknown function [Plasmodium berghei]SCM27093.1 conserved Plasmodium protein, unknown function [Plasmodium berghei]SCN28819.1 conserved Plasmodium protein, unknown function [Plasmodium berghei]SCO63122.1 conserved Plasmodium protein, unknown function [Plasmodium berghei]SCO64566.1 conserved Plasmodium protein, unknown function [Plasmodium berghei]|eukprot:XP_034424465.1 conserved protein, unknown function [Plasmodium berghei ANKA]
MGETWKTKILDRIKQRNINQNEIYENILFSYNLLVEEKNKLLAIIASFTSDNIYIRNNQNVNLLSYEHNNIIKHDIKYHKTSTSDNMNKNFSYSHITNLLNFSKKYTSISPNNKYLDNYENLINTENLLEAVRERRKNEEIIHILRNDLNEKEKLLNHLTKEKKALNNCIIKKDKELFKNKKQLSILENILNRKKQEIKLYANNNKSLKYKIQLKERQNIKLIREYHYLKYTYFKLLKQIYEIKNYTKNMDKEYFSLRNELLKKKIQNENLLKYLSASKTLYKNQLKKIQKMQMKNKTKIKSNKHTKDKFIFFKKYKFYVFLYLNKLHSAKNKKDNTKNNNLLCHTPKSFLIYSNDHLSTTTQNNYIDEVNQIYDGTPSFLYTSKFPNHSFEMMGKHIKNKYSTSKEKQNEKFHNNNLKLNNLEKKYDILLPNDMDYNIVVNHFKKK